MGCPPGLIQPPGGGWVSRVEVEELLNTLFASPALRTKVLLGASGEEPPKDRPRRDSFFSESDGRTSPSLGGESDASQTTRSTSKLASREGAGSESYPRAPPESKAPKRVPEAPLRAATPLRNSALPPRATSGRTTSPRTVPREKLDTTQSGTATTRTGRPRRRVTLPDKVAVGPGSSMPMDLGL